MVTVVENLYCFLFADLFPMPRRLCFYLFAFVSCLVCQQVYKENTK